MTKYLFRPWKNVKKDEIFFKLFWYKVFVHWELKLLNFLEDYVLSWQRTQPWPKLCCLERKFTLNFRPSPYQAPPSTRWITRHTKTESTSVSYLGIEQREQRMIRHGLCSPLENFCQKLVLKKKQLKLIYLLLYISSNNKSFKRQFRLSYWKIANKRRKKTNCAIISHLRLLGDWVGVVLNCLVRMFKERLLAQFPTQPCKSQSNKLQRLPKQSHNAMRHNTDPVYHATLELPITSFP